MSTKTTKTNTHNGRKTATSVIAQDFVLYFSKSNSKSEATYLTVGARNAQTGEFTKVRLTGRQVQKLRTVISA